jgi:phosphate transport system substrate-binding protein
LFFREIKMERKTDRKARNISVGLLIAMVLLVAVQILGCSKQGDKRYITIKGSDTMVHLVSSWAEAFMKKQPDIEVSVTGGGSGTGIAALINGTTDICAASRQIKEKERRQAEQRGISPKEIAVARDGIAVVVNSSNPVNELSMEQLAKMFTGAYTRWNQIGGPDEEIIVLSRESSSGTYVFFQEHVLKKQDYTQHAKLMPATSAIIQSVSTDKWATGYVGLGYALAAKDKIKIIAVKANENSAAVLPSEQTVKSGQYSIARSLYLYTNGQAAGTVKNFIDFCLSDQGQKIVRETGYVSVR